MKQFFVYRFRAQALLLCLFCVLTAMMVMMSSLAFALPAMGRTEGMETFRQRYPAIAEALRMRLSLTGEDHLLSMLYGFALPIALLFYAFHAVRILQAQPMKTGEAYWFVYARSGAKRTPFIHFCVITAGLLIQGLFVPLFALLPMLWQPGWRVDVLQLVLVAVGSGLFFTLPAGVFLLFSAGCGKEGLSRWPLVAALVLGCVRLLANVRSLPNIPAFLTPFSLYDPWGLARGQATAWMMVGIACAVGILCALAASWRFAQREMNL